MLQMPGSCPQAAPRARRWWMVVPYGLPRAGPDRQAPRGRFQRRSRAVSIALPRRSPGCG